MVTGRAHGVGPPPITRALRSEQPWSDWETNMRINGKMTMMRYLSRIGSIIIFALTILVVAVPPVFALQLGPDGAPNPTASVASEQQLLQQSPRIEGHIAQPNERARVLMQPAGRQWDHFHEITLRWLGCWSPNRSKAAQTAMPS